MDGLRFAALLGLPVLLAGSPAVWALVPGGQLPRSDCLAEWRVTTRNVTPSRGAATLDCQDGDPSCDADRRQNGACTFNVSVCVLQSDPGRPECVAPRSLSGLRHLTAGLEPPASLSGPTCGRATPIRLALRVEKTVPRLGLGRREGPGVGPPLMPPTTGIKSLRRLPSRRLRFRMTAVGGGMRDVDRLALRCVPSTSSCPPASECALNGQGPNQPNELALEPVALGPDLDLGWTGRAHDLPLAAGTSLRVCLDACDALVNPVCDTRIVTGPGTANGTLFGPPVPFVAGGVPVCLLREYDGTVFTGGTANLSTGALDVTIGLRAKMFLTSTDGVCPRCVGDRCEGGANDGGACTVDVTMQVPGGGDAAYELSRDCPPADDTLVGTARVRVPLTTGTSVLQALPGGDPERPCVAQPGEPPGVPPLANECVGACDAACAGGTCIAPNLPDPVTAVPTCLDARGGVSQMCCADDIARACFATPVERDGRADTPLPAWPDDRYPKQSRPITVATFCQAATGAATLDTVVGLPGPGALVFPANASWKTPAPCDGGGGGEVPAPY